MIVVANSSEEFAAVLEAALRRVLNEQSKTAASESLRDGPNRSVRVAAKALGVSVSTVRRRIRSGELKTVRIGARVLVPASEISRFRLP